MDRLSKSELEKRLADLSKERRDSVTNVKTKTNEVPPFYIWRKGVATFGIYNPFESSGSKVIV